MKREKICRFFCKDGMYDFYLFPTILFTEEGISAHFLKWQYNITDNVELLYDRKI
jgi:hypothetical protein